MRHAASIVLFAGCLAFTAVARADVVPPDGAEPQPEAEPKPASRPAPSAGCSCSVAGSQGGASPAAAGLWLLSLGLGGLHLRRGRVRGGAAVMPRARRGASAGDGATGRAVRACGAVALCALCGCTQAAVTAVGSSFPGQPVVTRCHRYGADAFYMTRDMRRLYDQGWRVVMAASEPADDPEAGGRRGASANRAASRLVRALY